MPRIEIAPVIRLRDRLTGKRRPLASVPNVVEVPASRFVPGINRDGSPITEADESHFDNERLGLTRAEPLPAKHRDACVNHADRAARFRYVGTDLIVCGDCVHGPVLVVDPDGGDVA